MARNGSGTFALIAPLAVASTVSSSTTVNTTMDDVATGLTDSINKDGTKAWAANQSLGGFKLTSMGDGSARTDNAPLGQVQDGKANWVAGGGTADAITATYAPAITALVDGQICHVRATAANATTTPTFSPNGLTARTIVKNGGSALVAGDIVGVGHELILRYLLASTRWELVNASTAVPAASDTVAGKVELATSAETTTGTDATRAVTPAGLAAANGGDVQTFTASGTWTKPTGKAPGSAVLIKIWGAGGSGGKGIAGAAQGGGGGGGYNELYTTLGALGATETVTVGTGGAAQTVASTAGNAGGNSTFGAHVTAYGGGGGGHLAGGGGGGGGGGGLTGAGATAVGGAGGVAGSSFGVEGGATGATPSTATSQTYGGGGGGGGAASDATSTNGSGGGAFIAGGGGGAGAEDAAPGPGSGGFSLKGGAGGAGAFDASNATAGTAPGGGGGGSEAGDSGAGANGRVEVYVF